MSEKLLGYRSWTADEKSYKIHQDQYMYNNLVPLYPDSEQRSAHVIEFCGSDHRKRWSPIKFETIKYVTSCKKFHTDR